MNHTTYRVPGMSCGHCEVAITGAVTQVAGVESIDVDLEAKLVRASARGALPAAAGTPEDDQ